MKTRKLIKHLAQQKDSKTRQPQSYYLTIQSEIIQEKRKKKEIKNNGDEVGLERSNALNFNPGIQRKCGYLVCRSRRSRMGEICATKDFVRKKKKYYY
jgi:hypothetical protein